MHKPKQTKAHYALLVTCVCICIAILLVFATRFVYTKPALRPVFDILPLPILNIEGDTIWSSEIPGSLDDENLKTFIYEYKLRSLVVKYVPSYTDKNLEADVKKVIDSASNTKIPDSVQVQSSDEQAMAVRVFVLKEQLRKFYNASRDYSDNNLSTAAQILSKLQNQALTMTEAERLYNENTETADFSGYTGYIEEDHLIPEIRESLSQVSRGSFVMVTTSKGHEILEVEDTKQENDKKSYSLREIFIKPNGFENWLDSSMEQINVNYYIRS